MVCDGTLGSRTPSMKLVATIPAANAADAIHQLVRRCGIQRRDFHHRSIHHRRDRTGRTKATPPPRHAKNTRPNTATRVSRASEMATATRLQRPTTTGTISVAIERTPNDVRGARPSTSNPRAPRPRFTTSPGTTRNTAATRAGARAETQSRITGSVVDPDALEPGAVGEVRRQRVVDHAQRSADGHMHVEVLVGAQAPPEQHAVLGPAQVAIPQQLLPVLRSVDGVVRLVLALGKPGELAHDHGLVAGIVALGVEVAELVDPRERHVRVGVVHHRGALEVTGGQDLSLEVQRPPAEPAL